jgi:hypothetical protein
MRELPARPAGRNIKKLFFRSLFHLLTVLNLVYKDLGRLETRDKVFFDNKSSIPRNVPGDLALALFVDKTAKASYIDVVAIRHGILHHAEKSLH